MSERHIDIIDKFLRGELSATEQSEFDSLMKDPSFKQEIDQVTEISKAAGVLGREELRNMLADWDNEKPVKPANRIRLWVTVAASVLMLVVAYMLVMPRTQPDLLAEDYLRPYPNLIAPLQKGDTEDVSEYNEAFRFYEMGYYGKAEQGFFPTRSGRSCCQVLPRFDCSSRFQVQRSGRYSAPTCRCCRWKIYP